MPQEGGLFQGAGASEAKKRAKASLVLTTLGAGPGVSIL